jgi:hypothetical protein
MLPIVVCTVTGRSLPVLDASVKSYCPGVDLLIYSPKGRTSCDSYNMAFDIVFQKHDEVIATSDDIVLTPYSYNLLMDDVNHLKQIHGDKLGLVCAHSDFARNEQNIRNPQLEGDRVEFGQWTWEHKCRPIRRLSPIFTYISKKAFEAVRLPPIEFYSDDVFCEDLNKLGFHHYISRSYVHHAGSQTIGRDYDRLHREAFPWIISNRPEYLDLFFEHKGV